MKGFHWFSGWKVASGVAWIFVMGFLGLTVAEISDYESVVQFFGESLVFTWNSEEDTHHYRVLLKTKDMTSPEATEICSTLYTELPELELEVAPGLAYTTQVQALSSSGDASKLSNTSPIYLCMGVTSPAGGADDVLAALPGASVLGPAYPNPFNSMTTIPFAVASDAGTTLPITLKIYNTLGQEVRTLVDENRLPGQYRVPWDARNDYGAPISAGTYICLLKAGEYSNTRMIVYAK